MQIHDFQIGGIDTYTNPLIPANNAYAAVYGLNQVNQGIQQDGIMVRAVNVDSYPHGAKIKRSGYGTFNSAIDSNRVNSLFQWIDNDNSANYLYRASGSLLYYYDVLAGTGDWTICGNGTITNGARVAHAVLENTLIISDGGTTRHTTNGISFTDTPIAPPAVDLVQFQNRIYAAGTDSYLYYSSANDATNWNTAGTSDSSSILIPDAGKLLKLHKVSDRIIAYKTSGKPFRWDGYALTDMSTDLGATSAESMAQVQDYSFYLNNNGFFATNGGFPELLSNPIQRFVYNDQQTGIAGTQFGTAAGVAHRYDYLCTIGTVRDDFTNEPLDKAIAKYSFQKNEWLMWQFNNQPTAWCSYKDNTGQQQLIFGDASGQVYQTAGTITTDNGAAINSVMEFVYHLNYPHLTKNFRWMWLFFNPSCQAKVQFAITDAFSRPSKKWQDIGSAESGAIRYRFPAGSSGKFLFLKIYEAGKDARWNYYGCAIDASVEEQR